MSSTYRRRDPVDNEVGYAARIPKKIMDEAKKNAVEIVDDDDIRIYASFNHYLIAAIMKLNKEYRE